MGLLKTTYLLVRAFLLSRLSLAAENLALRQQVAVYQYTITRPKLRPWDRLFWALLSRLWANWRSALAIVQPDTVIKWHRQGFKLAAGAAGGVAPGAWGAASGVLRRGGRPGTGVL